MQNQEIGQRIVIIGTTGTGKTTLACEIARRLDCPHIELDALYWDPHWAEAPLEIFRERVERALTGETWVVDGNYRKVRDLVWGRATTIIWLDYSLLLSLYRLTRRTVKRVYSQEELWSGNRETWRGAFFSRDSLFLWALKTHRRHRTSYPTWFSRPEYNHLAVIHLRSPRATERWLASF
jgi:adenylate kinase family enzyme